MAGEIVFQPTRGDYIAVAKGNFRRSLARRRFRIRMVFALLFAAALGAGVSFLDGGAASLLAGALAMGAMVIWLTLILIGVYLLIPRRSGRLFKQQRSLNRAFTLGWNETELTQHWDGGVIRTPWADYHDWFETSEIIAFGLNEQLYHFAPKRALTPDLTSDLRATASAFAGRGLAA